MAGAPGRADRVADQRTHPPYGRDMVVGGGAPVRIGATGTGDELLVLAWSASGLAGEIAAGARVFGRLGITRGVRVSNALPGALATPGALLVGDVNEAIGALDVPLGLIETEAAAEAAWALMDRVEVGVLVLDPTRAQTLLAAVPAGARPWWQGIIWLRTPNTSRAPVPASALGGWQHHWLAVPEVSSFVAGTCRDGRQHPDEAVTVAVVDGELTIAARGAAAYATGMRVRSVDACSCGDGGAIELS